MPVVTLNNGAVVDAASAEWRDECAQRLRHVQALRKLPLQRRRDYLDAVGRAEGLRARERLAVAYRSDWAQRYEDAQQ